jgi:hypothetical protein
LGTELEFVMLPKIAGGTNRAIKKPSDMAREIKNASRKSSAYLLSLPDRAEENPNFLDSP